jgi:hypothetical protein
MFIVFSGRGKSCNSKRDSEWPRVVIDFKLVEPVGFIVWQKCDSAFLLQVGVIDEITYRFIIAVAYISCRRYGERSSERMLLQHTGGDILVLGGSLGSSKDVLLGVGGLLVILGVLRIFGILPRLKVNTLGLVNSPLGEGIVLILVGGIMIIAGFVS